MQKTLFPHTSKGVESLSGPSLSQTRARGSQPTALVFLEPEFSLMHLQGFLLAKKK
jgi:hypothetical protein